MADNDDDEDDDVVFANSALHEYLKDVGFSDTDIQPVDKEREMVDKPLKLRWTEACIRTLRKGLNGFITAIFPTGFSDKSLILEEEKRTAVRLRDCKILLEDDYAMLNQFLDHDSIDDDDSKSVRNLKRTNVFMNWKFFTVLAVIIAFIVHQIVNSRVDIYTSCLITGTLIFIICTGLWRMNNTSGHRYNFVFEYIDATEDLLLYMRRSLRLVHEWELIARGYTLVTAKSPVAKLESVIRGHTFRQCPLLRESAFLQMRACLLMHRNQTRAVVETISLLPELDNLSHYVCSIPLEEYGDCLKDGDAGIGNCLKELTDEFSIPAIKAIYHICLIQCSEFVRRLAMCFLVETRPKNGPISAEGNTAILNAMKVLMADVIVARDSLKQSYNFHRCSLLEPKTSRNIPRSPCDGDVTDASLEAIKVAVHSLELHLLGALKRVRDFDSGIANLANDEEAMVFEYGFIKSELESSMNCWDEGENRIQKRFHPVESGKSSMTEESVITAPPKAVTDPLPIFDMEEPIIVDEMFELVTDGKFDEGLEDGNDEDPWELQLAKKKERTEAVRVLKELKCVISSRANELLEREQRALDIWRKRSGIEESQVDDDVEDKNDLLKTISDSRKIENGDEIESEAVSEANVEDRMKYKPKDWQYSDDELDDKTGEYVWSDHGDNKQDIQLPDPAAVRSLTDRIGFNGPSFAFTANVAALAAASSQGLVQDTFGDSSDDDDIED